MVTAVDAERDALAAMPDADVIVGGIGPVAAALATAATLAAATRPYDAVLSAGIAGGAPDVPVGSVVVADRIVFADQRAEGAGSLGDTEYAVDARLAADLAARTGGRTGTVLTVATVTGTAATAAERATRHAGALAEAMEGFGVAAAARAAGVPAGEVRAISNPIGPRDRGAWQVEAALAALAAALA